MTDSGASLGAEDDPNSDPTVFPDTTKEYALLAATVISVIFFAVPYAMNMKYAAMLPKNRYIKANKRALDWFERNSALYVPIVVFTGGAYPALCMVNSNLFGISLLDAGLSSFEMAQLGSMKVVTTVIYENVCNLYTR